MVKYLFVDKVQMWFTMCICKGGNQDICIGCGMDPEGGEGGLPTEGGRGGDRTKLTTHIVSQPAYWTLYL